MKALRPISQIARRYLVALSLAALVAVPAARLMAQSASESTQATLDRASADALDRDAAKLRQAADAELRRAQGFQKLADEAANRARNTDSPVAKEVWTETAGDRQKDADRLKKDAEQLQIQAAAKTAEAQRLRASSTAPAQPQPAPPGPAARPPSPPPGQPAAAKAARHADLVDFIGEWQDRERNIEVVLESTEPHDPSQSEKVKLTGRKNAVWQGRVELGSASTPTRFTFTRRPTWDEMNSEIPEPVRRKIEGQLEWKLELRHDESECVCVDATVQATWYPGEVRWTDGDGSGPARVSGPGNPIKFELTKADDDLQLVGYFAPTLVVHLGDPARARIDPVRYLVKGQPFQIQVLMSGEEAKKRGDTIELRVRGKAGGAESTVKLTLAPQTRKNIVVRYEHQDWITINDRGKVFGKKGGLTPGDLLCAFYTPCVIAAIGGTPPPEFGSGTGRLDLSVKNAEDVEFALDPAVQSVRVYNSEAKLILARYDDSFNNLAQFFNAVLSGAKYTAEQRRAADRRFQLARHAHAFVVDVPPEQINELVKVQVARLYYDTLIFGPVQQWYGIGGSPAPPANEYGFVWTSQNEKSSVENRIFFAKKDTRLDVTEMGLDAALKRLVPLSEALALGVPSMAFHLTPLGDAYIVFKGQDVLGHKVDLSDRIGAALNLGLSALTLGVNVASTIEELSHLKGSLRLGEEAVEFRQVIGSIGAPARSSIEATAEVGNIDRLIADALRSVERRPSCMTAEERLGLLTKEEKMASLKQVYAGAEIEIRPAPAELHEIQNSQGRCRFEAADTIAAKKTGQTIKPDDGAKLRAEMDMGKDLPIAKMEQNGGATDRQVRAYANTLGGFASSYVLTVPDIAKAHHEGFGVTVSIYLEKIHGVHQVAVWDVEYGAVGRLLDRPKYFILHDSNFPEYLIRMRARDLNSILAKPGMRVLLQKRTEKVIAGKVVPHVWEFETTTGPKGETVPVIEPHVLWDKQKNTDLYWYPPPTRP
jgi:hypothetical protein